MGFLPPGLPTLVPGAEWGGAPATPARRGTISQVTRLIRNREAQVTEPPLALPSCTSRSTPPPTFSRGLRQVEPNGQRRIALRGGAADPRLPVRLQARP